ncbi:uncharacterized protein LOC133204893 [Saccostrea echinata]|uniref:uncharacterized protein LOC133204893 n=1 Tax=Saccostrea echinata TaxID=191078 RepID=UPI002A8227D7|nr:uncharacterized protein LOC133204893 [Saccostrea echinata]
MYFLWILVLCIVEVCGHGKLWEPPSRSSMWRRGFDSPVNTNDNELNCGGYENHWIHQGGRCGVCGDPYQDHPRPNEAGGRYATGVITRKYKAGDVIDLAADLTANHVGVFEYRVCPIRDVNIPATQECFDKYPVLITESIDGRYHVNASENGVIHMKGRLPPNLSCEHCVLQWRYNTGNRWNCDINDRCGHGLGPQEEFYGCADISITENPDFLKDSRSNKRPLHLFEPLEIQLRNTLENFRSISRDYPTEKSYSSDIYPTSIDKRFIPVMTTELPEAVSDFTVLPIRGFPMPLEIQPVTKSAFQSALGSKRTKIKFKKPSIDNPEMTTWSPLTVSDYTVSSIKGVPVQLEIQPVTVKSAIQSVLGAKRTKINFKKRPSNTEIDPLDIKTTKHNGQKVAVLEKLSDMLWSMMKSLMVQSNKRNGQNIASVKWDPLKSLGKSPIRNTDFKDRYQFELKSQWPPARPMIVKADYGIDDILEGNPIVLREISPKEYLKSPLLSNRNFRSAFRSRMSEFDKFRKHTHNLDSRLLELQRKRGKSTTTQEIATLKTLVCTGAESFIYVEGINTWCTRNCKAGNCPRHMCRCMNKRVRATTSSMLTTTAATTELPFSSTKKPTLPFLSEFNQKDPIKEKISKQHGNVNFLSKEAYMDLYKQNPRIFGQKIKYVNNTNKYPSRNAKSKGTPTRVQKTSTTKSPQKSIICHGVNRYGQQKAIKGWCTENCRKGFCPKRVCVCKYG